MTPFAHTALLTHRADHLTPSDTDTRAANRMLKTRRARVWIAVRAWLRPVRVASTRITTPS